MTKTMKNTMHIQSADTKTLKIASLGFGKKLDCFGYLNSTTLSPINDKFIFAVIDEVTDNGIRHFDFIGGLNALEGTVNRVHTNGTTTTIDIDFTINNVEADLFEEYIRNTFYGKMLEKKLAQLPQGNHTHAKMTIQYRRKDTRGEELPKRFLGEINEYFFNGKWYGKSKFTSYTVKVTR